jgi:hypothetical protein
VATKRAARDPLFATKWVHVFEEDTAEGAVYRAEDDAIPLSRRPRERLEFRPDGSARLLVPGPDDRLVEEKATWSDEDGALVVGAREGGTEVRVLDRSPKRLVVKVRRGKPAR